ncbi:MAG: hypothetical protein P8N57_06235 [Flavobacteriaceae bacterium]|nr:hypothetical protein [Flavobacteriaceae bacterium]
MLIIHALSYFSGISFLGFGVGCFLSENMEKEFIRYGLSNYRKVTGFFQILGGLGLLNLSFSDFLWGISSFGLCVLMFLGFAVRIKIKDGLIRAFPSFFYMALNGFIFCYVIKIYFN